MMVMEEKWQNQQWTDYISFSQTERMEKHLTAADVELTVGVMAILVPLIIVAGRIVS